LNFERYQQDDNTEAEEFPASKALQIAYIITTLGDEHTRRPSLAKGRPSSTSNLQIFKLKFVRMFYITTINIRIKDQYVVVSSPMDGTRIGDRHKYTRIRNAYNILAKRPVWKRPLGTLDADGMITRK
jgi:hypothetical protein